MPEQCVDGGTRGAVAGDQLLSLSAICLFLFAAQVQIHFTK